MYIGMFVYGEVKSAAAAAFEEHRHRSSSKVINRLSTTILILHI